MNGQPLLAHEFDNDAWDALKLHAHTAPPQMPCCGEPAIPKTSQLGTHFFAHHRRGPCSSVPEGEQHLYLKSLVARAAHAAGWQVRTEWPGQSPAGQAWIADVFCEKGTARIALEVQLSPQTLRVFRERQEAYRVSGVRAAWFAPAARLERRMVVASKDLPVFGLLPADPGREPQVQHFNMDLSSFIQALLSKQIRWQPRTQVEELLYVDDDCWSCLRPVRQVYGRSIDVYGETAMTVPHASSVLQRLAQDVSNRELQALRLNVIVSARSLRGNAPGFPWCNACVHCGAPQSNGYLMKRVLDSSVMRGSVSCSWSDPLIGSWVLTTSVTAGPEQPQ